MTDETVLTPEEDSGNDVAPPSDADTYDPPPELAVDETPDEATPEDDEEEDVEPEEVKL